MEKFYTFDLQTLGELRLMMKAVKEKGDIPIEQKNHADMFERYLYTLQKRIKLQMDGVVHHASSSDF